MGGTLTASIAQEYKFVNTLEDLKMLILSFMWILALPVVLWVGVNIGFLLGIWASLAWVLLTCVYFMAGTVLYSKLNFEHSLESEED